MDVSLPRVSALRLQTGVRNSEIRLFPSHVGSLMRCLWECPTNREVVQVLYFHFGEQFIDE